MSIVTISRGSYSRGAEVAEKVASILGYACLARDALLEASEEYNIPEIKLVSAIEDPPSIFRRRRRDKLRYISFIRAALLKSCTSDNLVYHGLAGHVFLRGIGHVLKVRVVTELEERVAIVVNRDGVSEEQARKTLAKSDKGRQRWSLNLYGVDPEDPLLYDAVVHVGKMGPDGAAKMICDLVQQEVFKTTPSSQRELEDLSLAASIEALIMELRGKYDVAVTAHEGKVVVRMKSTPRITQGSYSGFLGHYVEDFKSRLQQSAASLPNLRTLEVEVAEE